MFLPLLVFSVFGQAHAEDAASAKDASKVHVGALFGAGLAYSSASYAVDAAQVSDGAAYSSADNVAPSGSSAGEQGALMTPLGVEARLHWRHMMVAAGLDWSVLAGGEQLLLENKQQVGLPDVNTRSDTIARTYDIKGVSPSYWVGASGVLGPDAAAGFGPRLGARWARTGLPRGQQAVASVGWAVQPPLLESLDPVRPMVDAELYGGVELPDADSLVAQASDEMFMVAGFRTSIGLMF